MGHVLAIPFPAHGHIAPLLDFCKVIAAHGIIVTLANVDSIHSQMVLNWVPPAGSDIRLRSIPFDWCIPKGFNASCLENFADFFDKIESMAGDVEELIENLAMKDQNPVTCIVSDWYMPFTLEVGKKLNIPRAIFMTASARSMSVEFHTAMLLARGHLPFKEGDDSVIDYIPGVPAFRASDIPMHLRKDASILLALKRAPTLEEASWIFINSFYDMEPDTFDAMRSIFSNKCQPVGPLFLLNKHNQEQMLLRNEDTECMKWLDKQDPGSVMYIAFGSIATLSMEQFQELLIALETLRKPFLWVIRPELLSFAVAAACYQDLKERTKTFGLTVAWAPQPQVLSHSSVGIFLTHCGWNSLLESVSSGVPMIGWPWGAEQNFNCKHIAYNWKVGMQLFSSGEVVSSRNIIKIVKSLTEGCEGTLIRKRSKTLRDAARKSIEHTQENLQAFIINILKKG